MIELAEQAGYSMVIKLRPNGRILLQVLAKYDGKEVSIAILAEDGEMNESTVRKHLKFLKRYGFISLERRYSNDIYTYKLLQEGSKIIERFSQLSSVGRSD